MKLTADAIASFLGGVVEGNGLVEIHEFAKIEEGKPGSLSFLSNPKYEHYIYTTQSSVVLVNEDFKPREPVSATLVRVSDAYGALGRLLTLADTHPPARVGIHPRAVVEPSAHLGQDVFVGAGAYIGEDAILDDKVQVHANAVIGERVRVGENTVVHANVTIYHDCEIGARCRIHAGAVIGADGFGFAPQPDGTYTKIPQLGNVVIGDDVEIGANTTIDRAALGATRVENGVKLDNLVQIAHNVSVGSNTVMAAQSGVAGSTRVGAGCSIGGQVGIVGHVVIADGVKLGAQAGVANSIKEEGVALMGSPAFSLRDYYRSAVIFKRLPEMLSDIASLKRELATRSESTGDSSPTE